MAEFPMFNTDKLKFTVTTGAGTDADVTVTGITTDDEVLVVLEQDATSKLFTAAHTSFVVTDTNDIQSATDDTTSQTVVVVWSDASA